MRKKEPFERLADLRRQNGFTTATDAARAFGWNENTYRSHENGERGLRRDVAFKYAQAFNSTANFILFDDVADKVPSKKSTNLVAVVGEVESNDKISYFDEFFVNHRSTVFAYVGFEVSADFIAFFIHDNVSISGLMPGSLIVCLKDKSEIEDAAGKVSIVYTSEGGHCSYIVRVNPVNVDQVAVVTPSGEFRHIYPSSIFQILFVVPPGQWALQRKGD